MRSFLKQFSRDRVGVVFGLILIAIYIVAITAQWIVPSDPFKTQLSQGM